MNYWKTGYQHCLLLWATLIFFAFSTCSKSEKGRLDDDDGDLEFYDDAFQADPTIFFHDGVYYLYGTNDRDPNQGFQVYTSVDLAIWERPQSVSGGYALRKSDVYGDVGFWAPQVWYEDGLFYMAYTANENIAIATSQSPLGPFVQADKKPLAASVKQIDPFVYKDVDGKPYLFHVRLSQGNRIFVAEMESDYSAIKEETLKECIFADQPWENRAQASWSVAEGPTVIHVAGTYYLFYSANDFRHPEYAVGYATSKDVTGPWEKATANPILSLHNTNWAGSGHGDLFTDAKGNYHYVFHTHNKSDMVTPRRTAIVPVALTPGTNNGAMLPVFDGPKIKHLKVRR